ncbi:hypothetical protein ADIS_2294 [Lunatimonas lonarensis]|uniref:Uncharacterized protein n=1 Tax=Lunatimonas lonarensis TaxID=1232681 RepID=R7ZT92_9BACT|nr:hypothetical protein ADIS_2294 [Lunatimonas lonarensis]
MVWIVLKVVKKTCKPVSRVLSPWQAKGLNLLPRELVIYLVPTSQSGSIDLPVPHESEQLSVRQSLPAEPI